MHSHTSANQQTPPTSRPKPRFAWMGTTMLILLTPPLALLLLLGVGAFFPRLPYVGALGSMVLPAVAPQAFGFALVSAAIASAVVYFYRRRRYGLVVLSLNAVALIATGTLLATQLVWAGQSGILPSPRMLSATIASAGAPDRSEQYREDDGAPLNMDIYKPSNGHSTRNAPVVLYVHGGGWNTGTPRENAAVLRQLAEKGYLVFAPEYTLATADAPTWDTAMPQVRCAIVWAAQRAASLGADPSRFAVFGGSAGGNLALAATYSLADDETPPGCGGRAPKISAVAAVVPAVDPESVYNNPDPLAGAADRSLVTQYLGGVPQEQPDRLKATQVATYLSPDVPPTYIVSHINDHTVPIGGPRVFARQADAAGVDLTYDEVPFADHTTGSLLNNPIAVGEAQRIQAFLERHGV